MLLLVDDDAFPAGLFELPIRWLASECAYFSALPRTSDEWRVVETEQKLQQAKQAQAKLARVEVRGAEREGAGANSRESY